MHIEISAQEYLDLLDIMHVADVVMSAHRREEDGRTDRHRGLIQRLYAMGRGEGLDHLIGRDESTGRYGPTRKFEENSLAHPLLAEFSDHLFWQELVSRLSIRDAALITGGLEQLKRLRESERQTVEGPIRQRYLQEFSTHGVANLEVLERFDAGDGMQVRTSD